MSIKPQTQPPPPAPTQEELKLANDFTQGLLDVVGAFAPVQGASAGRCKWITLPSAVSVVWVPGHISLTGFYTNGNNIAVTKDGQTFNQLNSLPAGQLDTVVLMIDNTTERNYGFMNVEVFDKETLTLSNQGLAQAWITLFYSNLIAIAT